MSRCRVCGAPIPRLALRDGDPYCSTECCKRDHDVPLAFPDTPGRPPLARGRLRIPLPREDGDDEEG